MFSTSSITFFTTYGAMMWLLCSDHDDFGYKATSRVHHVDHNASLMIFIGVVYSYSNDGKGYCWYKIAICAWFLYIHVINKVYMMKCLMCACFDPLWLMLVMFSVHLHDLLMANLVQLMYPYHVAFALAVSSGIQQDPSWIYLASLMDKAKADLWSKCIL